MCRTKQNHRALSISTTTLEQEIERQETETGYEQMLSSLSPIFWDGFWLDAKLQTICLFGFGASVPPISMPFPTAFLLVGSLTQVAAADTP